MFCTNCGHELPQDARTCPNCGNLLSGVAVPAAEPVAEVTPAVEQPVAAEAVPVAEAAPVAEVSPAEPAPEASAETPAAPVAETPIELVLEPSPAEAPAAEAAPVAPEAPAAQPAPASVTPPAPEQSAPTFAAPAQNTYQAPAQTYDASSSMGYTDIPPVEAVDPDAKKKGIAGLVIGIIGIVLCWVPFLNLATTVACVIGTVISLKAMKALPVGSDGRGIAIAGLSCSITGLVLSAGLMACYGCIIGLGVITDSYY